MYVCLHWVFVAARAFSSHGERGLLLVRSSGSRCADFSSCGTRAQQLWLAGSRAQAQQLWCTGLVAPWHVGSSQTRARTCVPCVDRRILNHCATREVRELDFKLRPELCVEVNQAVQYGTKRIVHKEPRAPFQYVIMFNVVLRNELMSAYLGQKLRRTVQCANINLVFCSLITLLPH